jgi:hypothetical protein
MNDWHHDEQRMKTSIIPAALLFAAIAVKSYADGAPIRALSFRCQQWAHRLRFSAQP